MEITNLLSFFNGTMIHFYQEELTKKKPIKYLSDIKKITNFEAPNMEKHEGALTVWASYPTVQEELEFENALVFKNYLNESQTTFKNEETPDLIWKKIKTDLVTMNKSDEHRKNILDVANRLGISIEKILIEQVGDAYGFYIENLEGVLESEPEKIIERISPVTSYSEYFHEETEVVMGTSLASHFDSAIWDCPVYQLKDSDNNMVSPYVFEDEILSALLDYQEKKRAYSNRYFQELVAVEATIFSYGMINTVADFDRTVKLNTRVDRFWVDENLPDIAYDSTYFLLSQEWGRKDVVLEKLVDLAISKGIEIEVQVGNKRTMWHINHLEAFLAGLVNESVDGGILHLVDEPFVYYHIKKSGKYLGSYLKEIDFKEKIIELCLEDLF